MIIIASSMSGHCSACRYIIKPLTIIKEWIFRESVVSALIEGIVSSMVVWIVALAESPLVVASLVESTLPSELASLPASHDLQTDSASRILKVEASNLN